MNFFAVTPDTITPGLLHEALPELRQKGAAYLYLRLTVSKPEILKLAAACSAVGIMPIVPHILYRHDMAGACGVHFKSKELSLISHYAPRDAGVVTASSHGIDDTRLALQAGADFVFISPVHTPLSKADDKRQPLSFNVIQNLIAQYGEKIVLLGGMTEERIQALSDNLAGSFSVAGISLFFGRSAQEEQGKQS